MATSTRASKNDHMTTLEFVFSLIARWIRSLTDMYSCSCLTPKKKNNLWKCSSNHIPSGSWWMMILIFEDAELLILREIKAKDVFYVKLHYFHKKQEWYFIDASFVLKFAQVLENMKNISWKQSTPKKLLNGWMTNYFFGCSDFLAFSLTQIRESLHWENEITLTALTEKIFR